MKEFRTEIVPEVSDSPIGLKDKIFTIGSCFADAVGKHLADNRFEVWNNAFGTVYNPISIHRLLDLGLQSKSLETESYLESEGVHYNYHFHSSISGFLKNEIEIEIKNSLADANQFLKKADQIIITYGTAFVYRLKKNNEVVANCHKMPSLNFFKKFLAPSEISESFKLVHDSLKKINPHCKIILTVSPVRHLKDTLELNSVSKSILRLACHEIVNQFSDVAYFPAYEILLDDLRDYRFYKTDRLHLTDEAVEYIWEKFGHSYFEEPTKKFIIEWQKIQRDLAHKPFHEQSERYQAFKEEVLKRQGQLLQTLNVVSKNKDDS